MIFQTLKDAVLEGQGVERPFKCHEHDDTQASASVNMAKMVWYCFACHASGAVDDKVVPTTEQLESMLRPEASVRVYQEAYLDLFNGPGHWDPRFPAWLRWYAQLGNDPFTGSATFPVRTPQGRLAGVGRRQSEGEPRYKYPWNWSASTVLGGIELIPKTFDHLLVLEGYADAVACWEVGIPAVCAYGAGLHLPQKEMIYRRRLKTIVYAYDSDDAGARATERSLTMMSQDHVVPEVRVVHWSAKDPGDESTEERLADVVSVLGAEYLPTWLNWSASMQTQYAKTI